MTMTLDGHVVGTPSYMSPEQATGDFFDGRTGIYSTGVILFQLLTGEKPFRGNHRMLLHQVVNEESPSPRKLNGSIPRDLETICLKCLEKTPGRRYSTSQEFADDLRRFLAGEPIRARPVHALEHVWKWAVRRPLVATLLTAFTLAVVLGITGVTWQWQRVLASQRRHVQTQLKLIQFAEPAGVESAIDGLSDFRELADPELRLLAANEDLPATARFRGQLALVEGEPERAEYVVNELLRVTPPDVLDIDELTMATNVLAKVNAIQKSRLTDLATDANQPDAARFRALFMLARTADTAQVDDGVPWEKLSPFTVRRLVALATTSPGSYRALVGAFRPIHSVLLPAFRDLLVSDALNRNEGHTAASIIGEYAVDQPLYLCDLVPELLPGQYAMILPHLKNCRKLANERFSSILAERSDAAADQTQKDELVARKAIAAVTLLHLNDEPVGVWPLFRQSPDTNLRTGLIHRCAELNLPPEKLVTRLVTESDVSARRAILLTLGEYHHLDIARRNELRPRLEDVYRSDPDAGIHSAVAWLLGSWDESALVRAMDREPLFAGPVADRQWHVNSQGATMVVIDHPPTFLMGAPEDEPLRTKLDRQHLRKVDRRFAIASTEVTWEQFEKFADDYPATNHSHPIDYGPNLNGPVLAVSWVQAAKYCRWLSEQEKISDDQMCFPELDDIHADMSLPEDLVERTGYRLPTEGEWECACRAGTVTRRFFGDSDEFFDEYCWHIGNSRDYAWSAGQLKPNDYGLFDIYGNAWEWCLDRRGSLPTRPPGVPFIDVPKLIGTQPRILRGGSMNTRTEAIRSAQRDFIDALHNRKPQCWA